MIYTEPTPLALAGADLDRSEALKREFLWQRQKAVAAREAFFTSYTHRAERELDKALSHLEGMKHAARIMGVELE